MAPEDGCPLSVDEALSTTRAVRKRLDFKRPVAAELLLECLNLAVQAPTGSNRQGWQWVFVSDPEKKRALAEHYARSWFAYSELRGPEYASGDMRRDSMPRVKSSALYLAEHMHEAPWLLIPCIRGRLPADAPVAAASATSPASAAIARFMSCSPLLEAREAPDVSQLFSHV
jgi:nitroreductase